MLNLRLSLTAVAVVALLLGVGARTGRAEQVLSAGGWTITSPTGIALVDDGVSGNTLYLEKEAAFTSPVGGLIINFTQSSASAVQYIEITGEVVNNLTGSTWNGFDFKLLPALGSPVFTSGFSAPGDQAGGSFTTSTLGSLEQDFGGGSQASGAVPLFWGQEVGPDGGILTIDTNVTALGTEVFGFKELPTYGTPSVPVTVPVPAAAYQTLAGLFALGLIGLIRRRKISA